MALKNIVIAVDGSEPSVRAARFAAELARGSEALLRLTYVIPANAVGTELFTVHPYDAERREAKKG